MAETHWKKLTDPNYLGSWDFAQGEERMLTIKKVLQEEVFNPTDNSKKPCIVAYFAENSKPMVINKTNCKTIATIYNTPIIEKWSGCKVIIVVEKVKAFGKLEEALRVKKEKPKHDKLMCADCFKEIIAVENYLPKQIADSNLKRYGKQICADCSSKLKAESGAK